MSVNCLSGVPGDLIARLDRIFRAGHGRKQAMAELTQRQIAKELGEGRRSMEGLGRVRMEVNAETYHYWGQRLGYQCWKDPQFLREMERDNLGVRVKCGGTRAQVGWAGTDEGKRIKDKGEERNRRFVKVYA